MARKKSSSNRKKTTRGGTGRRKRSRSEPTVQLSLHQKVLIGGITVLFLTAILILSLLAPNQGQLTAALSDLTWRVFGWGGLLVPLIGGAGGLYLVLWGMEQPLELPVYRLLGGATLFLVLETFASMAALMLNPALGDVWDVATAGNGGYLGGLLAFVLVELVGDLGAIFTLMVFGLIGGVLLSGVTRQGLAQAWQRWSQRRAAQGAGGTTLPVADREIRMNTAAAARRQREATRGGTAGTETGTTPATETTAETTAATTEEDSPSSTSSSSSSRPRRRGRNGDGAPDKDATAPAPEPITIGGSQYQVTESWQLPDIADILDIGADQDVNNASIREQVEIIEHTLESFGAPASVVEINQGPTVTQFGVEPSFIERRNGKRTKVKVGKIASLADDLALALAAHSVRIQAPVPGKGYVGVEVPNMAKSLVSLRDVMEAEAFQRIDSPLAIGLGQNVSGFPVATDLSVMPHLLIAGTTGSGKSVCVNGILTSLLLRNTPDRLKLVMVDPKRVELTGYNGIPHLAAPVVVEMDRVISTLQWALREMDERYERFSDIGARHIVDYNQKIAKSHSKRRPLPFIVIVIDELADLMMLAPEETEKAVTRLAQMARATGIHMVIATQRPSVDVVTGLIKANFPARIAFAVASSTDSRVILDTTGAERLLGQGDMLFQSPDAASPVRLQGAFVSDKELNRLITYWQRARRSRLVKAQESISKRTDGRTDAHAATPLPPQVATSRKEKAEDKLASPTREEKKEKPASSSAEPSGSSSADATPSDHAVAQPATAPTAQQKPLWQALEEMEEEEEEEPFELDDELAPEAIALVRQLKKASTSMLQRRFRIGYTRAARIMDYMEEKGIIGPPTGTSKAREVYLPEDEEETAEEGDKTDEK